MKKYALITCSLILLYSCSPLWCQVDQEALQELDQIDQEQIERYAQNEVAFQVSLEKKLCEALRPFYIKFYAEYLDEINDLRAHYNPVCDSQRVADLWNNFLDLNIENMIQATDPIFFQIVQEAGEENPSVLEYFRAIFRLKLREYTYAWTEQFLIESTAYSLKNY